jgi:hypothetical protein
MFFGTARFRGACLDTDYIVRSNEDVVVIRIGLESPMVDRSLSRFKARSAVFITASDPLKLTPREYRQPKRASRSKVRLESPENLLPRGEGRGTDGDRPPESSVLALGISRGAAASL